MRQIFRRFKQHFGEALGDFIAGALMLAGVLLFLSAVINLCTLVARIK